MQIRVISLKSATSRRQNIARQFAKVGVPFGFFDAVTPQKAPAHIDHYDRFEFRVNCGREATDTEIACYASHLMLWRQCAASGVPYLILEDDAELSASFQAGLLVVSSQIHRLGFVRVSLPEVRASVRLKRLGPFEIHLCRRAPLLALGYAISPTVASRLARLGATVEEPVDKFLQRFWRFDVPVYATQPPFVRLSSLARESEIGPRVKPSVDTATWFLRAMRKSSNAISRTLYSAQTISELDRSAGGNGFHPG